MLEPDAARATGRSTGPGSSPRSTFVTLVGVGGVPGVPGVLMDPLHMEFGWSHGTIGLAVSVNMVLFGLISPFAAALMDRFGIRAGGHRRAAADRGSAAG